jgi:DNA-binding IclR family transcriptional regulator
MAQHGSRDDAVVYAERIILDQLFEHYPTHLSTRELTSAARSDRITDGNVVDALAELLAQGVIQREGEEEHYRLTRATAHIADIGWSSVSV